MEIETITVSELTHQHCRAIRHVRDGNKIVIAKYYGRESVVLIPIQEYKRLKLLDKEEVKE